MNVDNMNKLTHVKVENKNSEDASLKKITVTYGGHQYTLMFRAKNNENNENIKDSALRGTLNNRIINLISLNVAYTKSGVKVSSIHQKSNGETRIVTNNNKSVDIKKFQTTIKKNEAALKATQSYIKTVKDSFSTLEPTALKVPNLSKENPVNNLNRDHLKGIPSEELNSLHLVKQFSSHQSAPPPPSDGPPPPPPSDTPPPPPLNRPSPLPPSDTPPPPPLNRPPPPPPSDTPPPPPLNRLPPSPPSDTPSPPPPSDRPPQPSLPEMTSKVNSINKASSKEEAVNQLNQILIEISTTEKTLLEQLEVLRAITLDHRFISQCVNLSDNSEEFLQNYTSLVDLVKGVSEKFQEIKDLEKAPNEKMLALANFFNSSEFEAYFNKIGMISLQYSDFISSEDYTKLNKFFVDNDNLQDINKKNFSLEALFIQPLHRVPKFPLFLKEISKNLIKGRWNQEEKIIQGSQEKIKSLLDKTQAKLREQDDISAFKTIISELSKNKKTTVEDFKIIRENLKVLPNKEPSIKTDLIKKYQGEIKLAQDTRELLKNLSIHYPKDVFIRSTRKQFDPIDLDKLNIFLESILENSFKKMSPEIQQLRSELQKKKAEIDNLTKQPLYKKNELASALLINQKISGHEKFISKYLKKNPPVRNEPNLLNFLQTNYPQKF